MDYYKIGQQVRRCRKAEGLSQEQLAERAGISVTHMSHIETGNTKLSLSVLVELARVLEVTTDELLGERPPQRELAVCELAEVLEGCTTPQVRMITDVAKAMKSAMEKYAP